MSEDPVTRAIDEQVNSKRIEEVDDRLTPTDQLLMSVAISLKRIADAFAPPFDAAAAASRLRGYIEGRDG